MPIIKFEPILNSIGEMERIFSEFPVGGMQGFSPVIDVYQDKDNVYVETPLAGVNPNDVDITIENDVLSIKGEVRKESELDDKEYYRKEIRSGSFYRSIALPTHVVADKAEAVSKDGMLTITIPKAPEAKPKSIKITAK